MRGRRHRAALVHVLLVHSGALQPLAGAQGGRLRGAPREHYAGRVPAVRQTRPGRAAGRAPAARPPRAGRRVVLSSPGEGLLYGEGSGQGDGLLPAAARQARRRPV